MKLTRMATYQIPFLVSVFACCCGFFVHPETALGQGSGELRVYRGQLPEFARMAQEVIDAMPIDARPRVESGRILFPESEFDQAFATRLAEMIRANGQELLATNDILDVESTVSLDSEQILLRVVAGRHGRGGDDIESCRGEDGVSVEGIREVRPVVILIVSGGNGGNGRCGPGGNGGQAEAVSLSQGGSLTSLGGNGGNSGVTGTQECTYPTPNALGDCDIGKNGKDGGNGGDASASTTNCEASVVSAFAGNGGNGILPQPASGKNGGNGGAGGMADADCKPSARNGPCEARAAGGNGGHGASGATDIYLPAGSGGVGGLGGSAAATSCCGDNTAGDALAVGGGGGNGGNGGNGVNARAGSGGKGLNGGSATAIIKPGITGSTAKAVSGSGGNGGNGGNTLFAGGAGRGGGGGLLGNIRAASECDGGKPLKVEGVNGTKGENGKNP